MTLDEIRSRMESQRHSLDEEAIRLRDAYVTLHGLEALYQGYSAAERVLSDQVATEWLLSDDMRLRFDGMALVHSHKVTTAAPALRKLAERLVGSADPYAPGEIDAAERLRQYLEQ